MGGLFKSLDLTGSKSQKKAVRTQQAQNVADVRQRENLGELAREDIFKFFPGAEETRLTASERALDVLRDATQQRSDVLSGSNVAAQQEILRGLPNFQNAILGTGIPQTNNFETRGFGINASDFLPQHLPDFETLRETLNPAPPQNFAGQNPFFSGQSGQSGNALSQAINSVDPRDLDPGVRQFLTSGSFGRDQFFR